MEFSSMVVFAKYDIVMKNNGKIWIFKMKIIQHTNSAILKYAVIYMTTNKKHTFSIHYTNNIVQDETTIFFQQVPNFTGQKFRCNFVLSLN